MALCLTAYGRNGVLFIGKGLAYHIMEETDLCWSAYGPNRVLFIGRGVAYRKTGLHGLLFIHRLLSRSSLHGLLFIHPRPPPASTRDCSSTPPSATVQLALHGLLFIQPSTGYCSTSPPQGPVHPPPTGSIRVLFIQ